MVAETSAARTDRKWPARRRDKAICVALFILLALTAVQCARLGVAGLYVQLAQNAADSWASAARAPGKVEIPARGKLFHAQPRLHRRQPLIA